jgi:hypothetical protein
VSEVSVVELVEPGARGTGVAGNVEIQGDGYLQEARFVQICMEPGLECQCLQREGVRQQHNDKR